MVFDVEGFAEECVSIRATNLSPSVPGRVSSTQVDRYCDQREGGNRSLLTQAPPKSPPLQTQLKSGSPARGLPLFTAAREGLQSPRYSRELFLKSHLTLQVKKLAPIWGPILLLRRGRDLNPRRLLHLRRFQGARIRPLCHLAKIANQNDQMQGYARNALQ